MSTTKELKHSYNMDIVALSLRYARSKKAGRTSKHPKNSGFVRSIKRIYPRGAKARKFLFQ